MLSADPNDIAYHRHCLPERLFSLPRNRRSAEHRLPDRYGGRAGAGRYQEGDPLDAFAAREMEVAQKLNQQIAASAPGTAPMLDAEASAWVVQANAYTQMGMAELLRLNSARHFRPQRRA